ncbi:MAG: hypothetical protein R3E87_13280 [Burkholderiaceae bacterium]
MSRPFVCARRQRGVMFYLSILAMLTILATVGIGLSRMFSSQRAITHTADDTLARTRELLLAELSQPDLRAMGLRLGQLGLFPDLPSSPGPGAEAAEPIYDGLAEPGGCASRTWAPGQPLLPVAVTGAAARCFGQLPWRTLGLSLPGSTATDPSGDTPWVIVSPNLAATSACLPNLNPLMLGQVFTTYACPSPLPYPWLRVVDAKGNLVSDRVAIAIIVPGPPLPGQVRAANAGPAAWLDRVTVAPGCIAPCQPGTYDNAGYTHANNAPWTLIRGIADRQPRDADRDYVTPYLYNDQLAFITIDDLLLRMQARAERVLLSTLDEYRSALGYLPFAAPIDDVAGDCTVGLRFGHPPVGAGSCGAGQALALPAWFTDAGWQRYFVYGVSARCVAGNDACDAPGLLVDTNADVDAVVFTAGSPLTAAPFAPSLGIAQRPLLGAALSNNPADWLDALENAAGTPDRFATPSRGDGRDNDKLSIIN